MLYVIIGLILFLVIIVIYGAWMRKKTYGEIDRIESWRAELMNRPVAKEMAKVKNLKMAGEIEKKFDKWRSNWDRIVTKELPSIEESLFTAEEMADKYRFRKAEQMLQQLHGRMEQIEEKIQKMIDELNAIVDSADKNRKDIIPIKESYHQIKKNLITKRSQFRRALPHFEQSVKKIDGQMKQYHSISEMGDYIEARKILLTVKEAVQTAASQMERIPGLYEDIQRTIPDQLKEIREGGREMAEQGYSLEHLQIDAQADEIEKHLQVLTESVEKMELDEAEEALGSLHEQLDWLYAQMEKEVLSRQQLHEVAPAVEEKLDSVGEKIKALDEETKIVRESYHMDVDDLKAQRDIEKAYRRLETGFFEVDELLKNHNDAFSSVLEKLKSMKEEILEVESSADAFSKKIKALRKDEIAAQETIRKLKQALFESRRIVQTSNMPGVPAPFADALEKAGESLHAVNQKLDEKPLDMAAVRDLLDEAEARIDAVHKQAGQLVDTADLAEEIIRYGNRYRSEYSEIDEALTEAERLFRHYHYEEAVKTAVGAIEKKEPKFLKRADLYKGRHQA
ncbi:septation ring formation regulator EzrA [Sporolactobacillus sp. THM7-7]|nr:septation ring formation regulator EzrA [Sporolactobacillus sp. THM7-7]